MDEHFHEDIGQLRQSIVCSFEALASQGGVDADMLTTSMHAFLNQLVKDFYKIRSQWCRFPDEESIDPELLLTLSNDDLLLHDSVRSLQPSIPPSLDPKTLYHPHSSVTELGGAGYEISGQIDERPSSDFSAMIPFDSSAIPLIETDINVPASPQSQVDSAVRLIRNRSERRTKLVHTIQSRKNWRLAQALPLDEPLSGELASQELKYCLGMHNAGHAKVLTSIIQTLGSPLAFDRFRNALQSLHDGPVIDLPAPTATIWQVLSFLDCVNRAPSALDLLRRVGLWRLWKRRRDLHQMSADVTQLPGAHARVYTGRRSQALDILCHNGSPRPLAAGCGVSAMPLRTSIKNYLRCAQAWVKLCPSLCPGIFALVPHITTSSFERVPDELMKVFVEVLETNIGRTKRLVAHVVSQHLENILGGQPCTLARLVLDQSITSWEELLQVSADLDCCLVVSEIVS